MEWPDTDDRMVEIDADRFVSGHGPVGERPALLEARDFIHQLSAALQQSAADGQDAATASRSATAALTDRYGAWRSFERLEESLPEVYAKL